MLDRVRATACAGLDVAGFLDEAGAALAGAVPNGTDHLDGPYWYTLDPQSQLITSDYGGVGCTLDTDEVMRWEYLADDLNKYDEVLRHPDGVQTLHEVTDGEPERSAIYRDYMAAAGIAQEALVALRSRSGACWGTVRLNRRPGEPQFGDAELDLLAAAAPHLADGIRRGLLIGEASDPDLPDAPGLVVLDADGEIESIGAGADRWLAALSDGSRGPIPASVASVAAAEQDAAGAGRQASGSSLQVRTGDGQWLSVHATPIHIDGVVKSAVIIEHAHRDRIAPLLMTLYGLTTREQDVTRLVLRGRSTVQIAGDLDVSPQTVQQHLKRIFEKCGVSSRRELVGRVFADGFDARVRDNGERVSAHEPIRGGPLRAVH